MRCTPERAGLEVEFSGFYVGPPSGRDLHDLD
jgi:regulation of enolase protein 1 (concanavalin A-like superfamily)